METVMITTTLNALNQTSHLRGSTSTEAYDDGELEVLLAEAANDAQREIRGVKFLSPELLVQALDGKFVSQKSSEEQSW